MYSSSEGIATGWFGFSLNNSMEDISAFNSGRETSTSTPGVVDMEVVEANTGTYFVIEIFFEDRMDKYLKHFNHNTYIFLEQCTTPLKC